MCASPERRSTFAMQGGIGPINFPLLSDITKHISRDYGILIEEGPDAGHALRCAPF
jgi:peroxiredoxin (alkyl hydroperoxide reductase subunit C)